MSHVISCAHTHARTHILLLDKYIFIRAWCHWAQVCFQRPSLTLGLHQLFPVHPKGEKEGILLLTICLHVMQLTVCVFPQLNVLIKLSRRVH